MTHGRVRHHRPSSAARGPAATAVALAVAATALLTACDGTTGPDGGATASVDTGPTGTSAVTDRDPDVVFEDDVAGRDADVTGTVTVVDGGRSIVDVSDDYYEGMGLGPSDAVAELQEGPGTVADLTDGDEVEVWVTDMCAESYPVQCGVLAVRVVG